MRSSYLALILFLCVSGVAGLAEAQEERAAVCLQKVDHALRIFQEKGRDYALKAIGSKLALTDREVYVFALSMENVMLAHPYKAPLVGQEVSNYIDVKGKYYFKEFRAVAGDPGEGWVEYWWVRPGEQDPSLKRSFIKKVPGYDIYIGSGYYPEAEPAEAR